MITDRVGKYQTIRRTLPGGVRWLMSILASAILLAACGGGGEDNQPPLTPAASLKGVIKFSDLVPLGDPPVSGQPDGIRYGARIIDPGDDIGGMPLPKPGTVGVGGGYEFEDLKADPLVYLNILFTVQGDLEGGASGQTPVGFNIPVSLADNVATLLSALIDKVGESTLEMTYTYTGPDGTREIRLRLDFSTDLLSFDLDSDGVFDDLIAVDFDHDAIADSIAPLLLNLDYTTALKVSGIVTAVGSSTITVANKTLNIAEITNIDNAGNSKALSLAEIGIGSDVDVQYAVSGNDSVALKVDVKLDPSGPQPVVKVQREGLIEQIDSITIFVGGILFQDYAEAQIVNLLDQPLTPADLAVGKYVTVKGTREGDAVRADFIKVHEQPPAPTYFEREGIIQSLEPAAQPAKMTLAGMEFLLPSETVFRDITGFIVGRDALMVGSPAWVYGHQAGEDFIADIVELKYVIEQPDGKHVEVVVVVENPDFMPQVRAAIDALNSPIPVALVRATNFAALPDDPPCVSSILNDLYTWRKVLLPMDGFQDAYAMPDGDQCKSLVVVEYGKKLIVNIINTLFPGGIGGSPIAYDEAFFEPPYGAGPEFNEALTVAGPSGLGGLVDEGLAVMVYASPDQGFSE